MLVSKKEGWYLGMDLGDHYPRGVTLWELQAASHSARGRMAYSTKMKHSEDPNAGYPVYEEISSDAKTYYRTSSDNNVYTELGHPGLIEINDTILVFFAGEQPTLDNSLVGTQLLGPRNLGFIRIPRDLSSDLVLSDGPVETGGRWEQGVWEEAVNRVSFLTSYADVNNSVSRLKTAELKGAVLLSWEAWTATKYQRSEYMIIDAEGTTVRGQSTWSFPLKLPLADDVHLVNGKAIAYVGSTQNKLVRYEFCYQDCDLPASATSTTSAGQDVSTTTTGQEASTTSTDASTTSAGQDASTTSTGQEASTTSTGQEASTTSTGQDASTTSAGQDVSTTSAGQDVSTTREGLQEVSSTTSASFSLSSGLLIFIAWPWIVSVSKTSSI